VASSNHGSQTGSTFSGMGAHFCRRSLGGTLQASVKLIPAVTTQSASFVEASQSVDEQLTETTFNQPLGPKAEQCCAVAISGNEPIIVEHKDTLPRGAKQRRVRMKAQHMTVLKSLFEKPMFYLIHRQPNKTQGVQMMYRCATRQIKHAEEFTLRIGDRNRRAA
jgi:hypothetical protein